MSVCVPAVLVVWFFKRSGSLQAEGEALCFSVAWQVNEITGVFSFDYEVIKDLNFEPVTLLKPSLLHERALDVRWWVTNERVSPSLIIVTTSLVSDAREKQLFY